MREPTAILIGPVHVAARRQVMATLRARQSQTMSRTPAQILLAFGNEVLDWIDANADRREVEALVVVDGCDVGRRDALGLRGVYLIGPLDHTDDPEAVGR
jgi:hypothetical protein